MKSSKFERLSMKGKHYGSAIETFLFGLSVKESKLGAFSEIVKYVGLSEMIILTIFRFTYLRELIFTRTNFRGTYFRGARVRNLRFLRN